MKVNELNKHNALTIKNNLNTANNKKWIKNNFKFEPKKLYQNDRIKIYIDKEWSNPVVVTDLNDNILCWFAVYDLKCYYQTKYEYIFIGHEQNYHIDLQNGNLTSFSTR